MRYINYAAFNALVFLLMGTMRAQPVDVLLHCDTSAAPIYDSYYWHVVGTDWRSCSTAAAERMYASGYDSASVRFVLGETDTLVLDSILITCTRESFAPTDSGYLIELDRNLIRRDYAVLRDVALNKDVRRLHTKPEAWAVLKSTCSETAIKEIGK